MQCKTCEQSFDESELANAVLLIMKDGVSTYRFVDGTVHSFRKPMSEKGRHSLHLRWHLPHKNKNGDMVTHRNPNCKYCYPELFEEPFMGSNVTEARQVADNIVEPAPPDIDPGVQEVLDNEDPLAPVEEVEEVSEPPAEPKPKFRDTTMSYAFKKYKETN